MKDSLAQVGTALLRLLRLAGTGAALTYQQQLLVSSQHWCRQHWQRELALPYSLQPSRDDVTSAPTKGVWGYSMG